jgi:hypothetical protein
MIKNTTTVRVGELKKGQQFKHGNDGGVYREGAEGGFQGVKEGEGAA